MSNFSFLKNEWLEIYQSARRLEEYLQSDPRSACFHARRALELAVQWLYAHDPAFQPPYDDNLAALLSEPCFRKNVPDTIYNKAQYLRKSGNLAVHSNTPITAQSALGVAIELYHVLYWLARTYTRSDLSSLPQNFDEKSLPAPAIAVARQSLAQLQKQSEVLKARDEALLQQQRENEVLKAQLAAIQSQVARQKAFNQAIPDRHDYSEAETRRRLIDILLLEAGWNLTLPKAIEYQVTGMPTNNKGAKGIGYVDYVLWGDDGLPLGLVEAKRTSVDAKQGQQQAKLYADCLEAMHGQRPIIFYSNGYTTHLWDDQRYPPRQVQGFYSKDELMWMIQRRELALPLQEVPINQNIVNRAYQVAAIRQMAEHFSRHHRKGLLVMATGAGKTRVAIALVDLLMSAGWVKRVLFLADRSALVKQTTNAFKTHLPTTNPVNLLDSSGKEQAATARVVVSTYHTMMNLIDEDLVDEKQSPEKQSNEKQSNGKQVSEKQGGEQASENNQKLFSVGHFDLVIIDEAHRSVYQKFAAIFNYFDSLLVGLTATPKDDVDHNTYRLFELEEGVPTFAYDLEQAIADGFLVYYRSFELPTKFTEQGIKYAELSDAEKAEWERLDWGDSEAMPDEVSAAAINAWILNTDTVDQILKSLMLHGLKVAGGDRLGKTIIFAKNHKHAEFIAERFNFHYPHLKGTFARVIDNHVNYAQTIIDDFSDPRKEPHIAISVDMLDTGIDVPEVVNLLFFKTVRSKSKFFQMLGRGTRLCPNLFGPGDDKSHFLIFDACSNFEFFGQNPAGVSSNRPEPLSQSLFKKRLDLLDRLRKLATSDASLTPLATALTDTLHAYVAAMDTNNFIVRPQRAYVDPFQARQRWENLSRSDAAQLAHYVSGLPSTLAASGQTSGDQAHRNDDEGSKRFDLIVIDLQLAHIEDAPRFNTLRDKIIDLATDLAGNSNIPLIYAQLDFLLEVQSERFWDTINLLKMEEIRQRLRALVSFANKSERQVIYTAFKDQALPLRETKPTYDTSGVNSAQYKKKVEKFIRDHEDYVVIQKIHWGIRLNKEDLKALETFFYNAAEIGGQQQFLQIYGKQENLAAFIRSLIGLDRGKAKVRFAQFLDGRTYTADQIRFVDYIIDHLAANGTIDPEILYDQPYTDIHSQGLTGLFAQSQASALLGVVREVNLVVEAVAA